MSFGPRLRKLVLTMHVVASVGWLGAVGGFLALAIVGLTSDDLELVRGVYLASEPLAVLAIVPLAIASLVTGLAQSLGTHWGLVRHYWVIVKLVISVFAGAVLLLYTKTVVEVAEVAGDASGLAAMRSPSFVFHSAVGMLLLLLATGLAVYKPRGLTRYGWRRQQAARAPGPPAAPG